MLVGCLIDSSKHDFYGETCQDCRKRMRVGDVAMVFDRGNGVFVDRDLVWHRHCIEAALLTAPVERDRVTEAFEDIRRRGIGPLVEALDG